MEQDTSAPAAARYFELLRRQTPQQRLRTAVALSAATRRLAETGVRQRMPGASEHEIRRELTRVIYGEEAARRLFGQREQDDTRVVPEL
jgi:hypothetical protein